MMSTTNGGHYQTISTTVSARTPDAYPETRVEPGKSGNPGGKTAEQRAGKLADRRSPDQQFAYMTSDCFQNVSISAICCHIPMKDQNCQTSSRIGAQVRPVAFPPNTAAGLFSVISVPCEKWSE